MKALADYRDKQVLVLGMAKSGFVAAQLLQKLGADVTLNDRADLQGNADAERLRALGIRVVGGGHPEELVNEDLFTIVKNPGVPYTNPLLKKARELGIRVITEVELAYELSEAPFMGVTGSNGKTTTTMLLGEMMKGSRYQPIVAGNIGTVLSEVVQGAGKDNVIVAELSSFQLMGTEHFRPHVAVVLNLFDHHLDYHGTLENYAAAKARITLNQTAEDFLVYNADSDRVTKWIAGQSKAAKIPFSVEGREKNGAYIENRALYYKGEHILDCDEMGLPGEHNLENALAALAAAKVYHVPTDYIVHVLKNFKGVRHRLQLVGTVGGRTFYNDSKATNILATAKALASFPDKEVILLAGGLDRGNTFDALVPHLKHAKAVVLFGETKNKLLDACRKAGIKTIKMVENVEEAVPAAFGLSQEGDVILLSPACASWDQYDSFEQRGDIFMNKVHMLS